MKNMENENIMKICDLSPTFKSLGPRFKYLGANSGEEFRERYLIPWLNKLGEDTVGIVDFEGVDVYSPSFLEESFGGAIRMGYKKQVQKLRFINIKEFWFDKLQGFIKVALDKAK
jgi:hypothetical protein